MDARREAVAMDSAVRGGPTRSTARRLVLIAAILGVLLLAALAAALVFGGPRTPPPMASINDPFKSVEFGRVPELRRYTADDRAALAYRFYPPEGAAAGGSVVLVHGSSASSESMHVLATAYARAGYPAYSLDIRGHGASGTKGSIGYVGQLDDDLARFLATVAPPRPVTLVGFSSGGGFVLRVAGGVRQQAVQSCVLLSPYLGQRAPNYRPGSGGWVNVGVPRVAAVSLLNAVHVHAFDGLPVVRFALNDEARRFLTPEYSYTLAANFGPPADYAGAIRSAQVPCAVLGGTADEAFDTSRLEAVFRGAGKDWPVTLLPGINHIGLITDPRATQAAVDAVRQLRTKGG